MYDLPVEYAAEEARVRACAAILPQLTWETAEAVFHGMVGPAVATILARFEREGSANNYYAQTTQQAVMCACIRIIGAEDTRAEAWMINEECEAHLMETDTDGESANTWEAAGQDATAALLRLWQAFHARLIVPGASVRAMTLLHLPAFRAEHGCDPTEYALRAMLRALVPQRKALHFYEPLGTADFDTMVEPVAATLQRRFHWRSADTADMVLVHKVEAVERMAELFMCDPAAVGMHLSCLELQGLVRWPACLVQLGCLFQPFRPPLRIMTFEQVRINALCRARSAVVRALSRGFPAAHCVDGRRLPIFMDVVTKALLLLLGCLQHTCFPASNPYSLVQAREAVAAFPRELYKYWAECVPALLAGDSVAHAASLEACDPKWRRLLVASVAVHPGSSHPPQCAFSLYNFLQALERKSAPVALRMVQCTDDDWPTWTPATAAILSNVFPPDAGTCAWPCVPLTHLSTAVDKHLAFAPPSPRLLFTKVYRQCDVDTLSWVDAFAMVWGAAYAARRDCEALCALDMPLGQRRSKRIRRAEAATPCLACGIEHRRMLDGCEQHPLCCQCYLTSKETLLVGQLKASGSGGGNGGEGGVTACCIPGCAHVHSLEKLRALLTSDMRTVLHMVTQRRPAHVCAFCGVGSVHASDDTVATCALCRMGTCQQCLGLAHTGEVCSAAFYREVGMTPDAVLSEAKMQRCPSCTVPSVKSDGCNHMTCTCGRHWCWLCGEGVDARDPSAHFADVEGGTAAAPCMMRQYSTASEVARMVAVITRRTDLTEELKAYCIEAVSGKQRSGGTLAHTSADI